MSSDPDEFLVNERTAIPPTARERLRLAVPDPLVPGLVRFRTRRRMRGDAAVSRARAEMEFLLSEVADPAEIEAVAQRYVERDTWRSELRWHPKMICYQPVSGVDHLRAARAAGRGVVISFLHHGHYEGAVASVSHAEEPIYIALAPEMCGADAPSFLRQHVRTGSSTGGIGVNVAGGAGLLGGLLMKGNVLAIATDVPGRMPVTFLGKERYGSSGAARLAAGTNSLVVVMTAHCDDDGSLALSLGEPIEPQDFASPEDLVVHLLHAQEEAVRAWPEGYHHPTLRWGSASK